eukprot:11782125-Prorocentrum_lima.AAC.1
MAVHTVIENAGSMLPEHRAGILRAMAIPEERGLEHTVVVNSGEWTAFPRRRLLIASLPLPERPWVPSTRPPPWDQGWVPHPEGEIGPMLQARSTTPN